MDKLKIIIALVAVNLIISGGLVAQSAKQPTQEVLSAAPVFTIKQGGTGTTTGDVSAYLPTASSTARGLLSSDDWSTFNGKQSSLSFPLAVGSTTHPAETDPIWNAASSSYSLTTHVQAVDKGGTGTTSAPSSGQILIGNVSGGYSFVASSTLGGSGMVYPGSGIALSTGSAWGASITDNSSNWNTAYTDRFKWDGGSTGLTVTTAWTSLGLGTMASNATTGSTTITTLGTIGTGTWNAGALTSSGVLTVNGTANSYIAGRLGIATSTFFGSSILQMASSSTSYLQAVIQNTSATASSSADFVVNNDKSTDTTWFTNLGQNSSAFSMPSIWTINGANDGYLMTNGGNLSVGVSSSTRYLNFFTGGTLAANERMRIDASGNISIGTTSASARLDIHGAGTTTLATFQTANSAGTANLTVYDSGTTTIGTTTNTSLLNVGGQILANSFNAISALITSVFQKIQAVTELLIPTSTNLQTPNSGDIGIDTTSGQLRYNNGSATTTLVGFQAPSVTIASTSWSTTGTTTIPIGVAMAPETWSTIACFTDTATTTVDFGDGTNWMTAYTATTTPSTVTVSSNNSFTLLEKRYIRLYSFTGSPNYLSCSVRKTYDAD